MRKATYAIFFVWKDGTEDSIEVYSAQDRVYNIYDMLRRGDFKRIWYERVYSNGDRGKIVNIL